MVPSRFLRSKYTLVGSVLLTALLLRVARLPGILSPAGVTIQDPDACYHLRRALAIISRFPVVPRHDTYLGFPEGGDCPWPPLLDLLLASMALPFGGGKASLETVAVALPPLIGVAQVVLVLLVGREIRGFGAGVLAALLLAVLPVAVWQTMPGLVDHHAPTAAVETLAVLAAIRWCKRARYRDALLLGLAVAAGILTFLGVLLFLPVLEAWTVFRTRGKGMARQASLAHALAAALVAVPAYSRGGLDLVTLSWAHPLLLLWPAVLYAVRSRIGGRPFAWIAALAGGWVLVAAPGLAEGVSWALRQETFMAVVAESRPLLWGYESLQPLQVAIMLSPAFFVAPVLAIWAVAHRRNRSSGLVLVAGWSVLYWALSLQQRRFARSLVPALCLLVGWAILEWYQASQKGSRARIGLLAAAILTVGLPLQQHLFACHGFVRWAATGRRALLPFQLQQTQIATGLRWLKEHSPPASLDPLGRQQPTYGVLSAWGLGHLILYHAERPALATNFGTYVAPDICRSASSVIARGSRNEDYQLVDSLGVRYIVVTKRMVDMLWAHARLGRITLPEEPENRLAWRLFMQDGSGSTQGVAARTRLLWETGSPCGEGVKIFEVVRGARVIGNGPPGAQVTAAIPLLVPGGRTFVWMQTTLCGDDGRFSLVLPYPTAEGHAGARALAEYQIRAANHQGSISLSEQQVITGETVTLDAHLSPIQRSPQTKG